MSGCMVLKTSIICRPSVRCDQRRDSLFCTLWWLWEPAVGRIFVQERSRVCCGARLKSPRTRMRVLCFFSFCTSPISVSAHLVYSCAEASEDAGAVGAYMLKIVMNRVLFLNSLLLPNLCMWMEPSRCDSFAKRLAS